MIGFKHLFNQLDETHKLKVKLGDDKVIEVEEEKVMAVKLSNSNEIWHLSENPHILPPILEHLNLKESKVTDIEGRGGTTRFSDIGITEAKPSSSCFQGLHRWTQSREPTHNGEALPLGSSMIGEVPTVEGEESTSPSVRKIDNAKYVFEAKTIQRMELLLLIDNALNHSRLHGEGIQDMRLVEMSSLVSKAPQSPVGVLDVTCRRYTSVETTTYSG
ncbi:hypothetical protein HPP92_006529 [Vanilla planifolia]|uniref:Uncharacterized protein n=1 Tax=Vanilla planifolia TaxID=51239 RepID=A0A835RJ86_VANPL|nr:hypothetical protein HPP92_006529 [Vanilla planifolia]